MEQPPTETFHFFMAKNFLKLPMHCLAYKENANSCFLIKKSLFVFTVNVGM